MTNRITILGSTGSIGVSTIDVIGQLGEGYEVDALTGNGNIDLLARQARQVRARLAVTADENRYLVAAALTLSALVGAVVFAAISRRRGLIITACVIGCLGLVITFAVPVPADRFTPEPQPAPVDPGGGGGCMGEGDPYCVGG